MSSQVPGEKRFQTMGGYADGKYTDDSPNPFPQGDGNLGKVFLDDNFFDFLQQKKELEIWNDYENFKLSLINTGYEALREWWKRHHPDLWQKKVQAYNDQLEIKKKYDMLMMTGANSEEDLRWLYLASVNAKGSFKPATGEREPFSFARFEPKHLAPKNNLQWESVAKDGTYYSWKTSNNDRPAQNPDRPIQNLMSFD